MKKEAKKLSLADFKAKSKSPNTQELLNKITGGMLDDCHVRPGGGGSGGGGPVIGGGGTDDAA